MAFRWFYLVIGILCIVGYHAFSPIPEETLDDEWVKYNEQIRDPNYRLSNYTRPSHYALTLAPYLSEPEKDFDPKQFTFDGDVTITISTQEDNVNEIVLHCNNLTIIELAVYLEGSTNNLALPNAYECEMPGSFLKIYLNEFMLRETNYTIKSKFSGTLQNNMRGFYRSWYKDSSNTRRWMATTQFQPGHARQAFPCFDEPGFKARFDITIIREVDFSSTLSNMPIKADGTIILEDGRVSETFETTTITSTYLVAFIVSHYQRITSGDDIERPFHIYARDNADDTGDWSLRVGELLLKEMEDYTEIPYYNMTDKIIMQQAAIPDFSAGAMENWGLLTYREALILYDRINSNHFYKQRVANIVSHEVVHQWFGNLVTCAWWDNLWLNEGFARYYQYYLTANVTEGLGYETRFIVEQVQVSLLSDSEETAHALTDPNVVSPATVSAHFSQITYGKGAAVLRMTEHLLGVYTYKKGLRLYLSRNKNSVAEPEDLFEALNDAAVADNALVSYGDITVEQYMSTWTLQGGHPLLTVVVDHTTGRMTVTQQRFNIETGVSAFDTLWYIPVTWTRGGAIDFDGLKPSQFITLPTTIIERGSTGNEWVIFNRQQAGFYRVNYDSTTWLLITQALRNSSTRNQIHEYNRAQIVDDVFILARSGIITYNRALNILSFLEYEDQYAPWIAAIAGFNFARRRLAHDDGALIRLHSLIYTLSTAVTARLGFAEVPDESYMDGLQRMYVNTFLCNIGHQQCIEAGKTSFTNWIANKEAFIPANMRPWVYCTGLRHGSASDFDVFWTRYLDETLASEQVVMLQAAGCTKDKSSLRKLLNAITAGPENFDIRDQDQSTALNSAITSNEENNMIAFEWLNENIERTTKALGSINSPLRTITSRLLTGVEMITVAAWLETKKTEIGESAYNAGREGWNISSKNLQWFYNRASEFEYFFENGFDDETFEDDIVITTPEPPQVTLKLTTVDSGNMVSISSFAVLTVLALYFV